jgi:hypothetical protein
VGTADPHRVRGDLFDAVIGHVAHDDVAARRGGQVDVVDADAVSHDETAAAERRQRIGVEGERGTDQDRVGRGRGANRVGLRQGAKPLDVDAGALEHRGFERAVREAVADRGHARARTRPVAWAYARHRGFERWDLSRSFSASVMISAT